MVASRELALLIALAAGLATAHAEGFLTDREVARFVESGNAHYRSGKLDEAEKAYTEALTLRPGTPGILRNLGHTFYQKGDFARAQEFYDKAKAAQATPSVHHDQANTAFQQGRLDEAIQMYRQVLKEDPLHMDAKYNLEVALAKQQEQQKQDQNKDDKQKKDDKEKKDEDKKDDKEKKDDQEKKDDEKKDDQEKKDDEKKDGEKGDPGQPSPQPSAEPSPEPSPSPQPSPDSGGQPSPQPSPSPQPQPESSPSPGSEGAPPPEASPSAAPPPQDMIERTLDGLREDEKQTLKEALRRMVPRNQEPVSEYDW